MLEWDEHGTAELPNGQRVRVNSEHVYKERRWYFPEVLVDNEDRHPYWSPNDLHIPAGCPDGTTGGVQAMRRKLETFANRMAREMVG